MTTGENIAKIRRRNGLTQLQLARDISASPGYVSAIESGRRHPALKLLAIIARALGVEIRDLKGGHLVENESQEGGILLPDGQFLFSVEGKIYLVKDVPSS